MASYSSKNTPWTTAKERNAFMLCSASERIAKAMKSKLPKVENNIAVLVTGSDGRKEKGFLSPMTPIVLHRGFGKTARQEIVSVLEEVSVCDCSNTGFRDIECKDVNSDFPLSYAYGDRGLVFPQRVMEGSLLFGNEELLVASRNRLASEWASPEGKRISTWLHNAKRNYKNASETGQQAWKGKKIVNYSLEDGIAYYYDDKKTGANVRSFKNGPLRLVQNALMLDMVCLVRKYQKSAISIVAEVPTPVVEKLEFLESTGKTTLSKLSLKDAIDSYLFFLLKYHNSENLARHGQAESHFNPKEAIERIDALVKIFAKSILQ